MSNKVYIHVGMQKTGSSWLQKVVFPQVRSHDVIYKESFRDLMYQLTDKNKIISYENYVGYPHFVASRGWNGWLKTRHAAFNNLSALFPCADIILVVRNQVDFVKSLYNQYIKVGGCISFADYWQGDGKLALEKQALMYEDLLDEMQQYFSGRILVMDFELFRKDKQDFLDLISNFVGGINDINIDGFERQLVNESLSPSQLRAMLCVSRILGNYYNPSALVSVHNRLFKFVRYLTVRVLSVCFSSNNIEDDQIMEEILHYYADDWKAISQRFQNGYFIVE